MVAAQKCVAVRYQHKNITADFNRFKTLSGVAMSNFDLYIWNWYIMKFIDETY